MLDAVNPLWMILVNQTVTGWVLQALRSREMLEGGLVGLASPPDESRDRGGRDVSMGTGTHRCVGFKRELSGAAKRLHSRAASDS